MRTMYYHPINLQFDIEPYKDLIRKLCWEFARVGSVSMSFPDLYQSALLQVIIKSPQFNPSKGKESTFIHCVVFSFLTSLWRKEKTRGNCIQLDESFENIGKEEHIPEINLSADALTIFRSLEKSTIPMESSSNCAEREKAVRCFFRETMGTERTDEAIEELKQWYQSI